jgi:hypothetical protein
MVQGLQAQKLLNGFLQRLEAHVAGKEAEMPQLIAEIRVRQVEHQKTLTRLVALADPQAKENLV